MSLVFCYRVLSFFLDTVDGVILLVNESKVPSLATTTFGAQLS